MMRDHGQPTQTFASIGAWQRRGNDGYGAASQLRGTGLQSMPYRASKTVPGGPVSPSPRIAPHLSIHRFL